MALFRIRDAGKEYQRRGKAILKAMEAGLQRAAAPSLRLIRRATPKDEGELRDAWRIRVAGRTVEFRNNAPHFDQVEYGTPPREISGAEWRELVLWVGRHRHIFGDAPPRRVANAIAKRIREKGMEPTYFLRKAAPELIHICQRAIDRELRSVEKAGRRKKA